MKIGNLPKLVYKNISEDYYYSMNIVKIAKEENAFVAMYYLI